MYDNATNQDLALPVANAEKFAAYSGHDISYPYNELPEQTWAMNLRDGKLGEGLSDPERLSWQYDEIVCIFGSNLHESKATGRQAASHCSLSDRRQVVVPLSPIGPSLPPEGSSKSF